MTLREQILAAQDRQRVAVPVPEWGVTLYAAPMSSAQQIDYANALADKSDSVRRALIVVFGTTDDNGDPVFTVDDAETLAEKNWKALDRLTDVILAPTIDAAKKNS